MRAMAGIGVSAETRNHVVLAGRADGPARTDPAGSRYGDEAFVAFARNLAPAAAGRTVTAITDLLDSLSDGLDDDTAVLAISVPVGRPR